MKRETLKKYIDNIIIHTCRYGSSFFTSKSDDGENMIVNEDILPDPLDAYNVLSSVEKKCGILVNDEAFNDKMTYREFIDVFWEEIKREHKND